MSPQEPVETSPPLSRARPCGRDSGLAGAAGSPSPGRSQPCPGGCGGRAGVHRVSRGRGVGLWRVSRGERGLSARPLQAVAPVEPCGRLSVPATTQLVVLSFRRGPERSRDA